MAYELPTCECFRAEYDRNDQLQAIYCALLDVVENTGGSSGSGTYTSVPNVVTGNTSIPVGALGWSVTALSGTVTVAGDTLPVGATISGGGYGGKTLAGAIAVGVTAGSAIVTYDT